MWNESASSQEPVTVVSGLPRSGTSMMMQLLAAGGVTVLTDNVRQADADNPRGYYEFERVKQLSEDSSWLDEAGGKAVKMVYRLLYDLPSSHSYRVIFLRRNLKEVIESQAEMLRRLGKSTDDVPGDRLIELYRRQLTEVDDWLCAQPNFQVLYIEYHDVLGNPDVVVTDIDRFLGGGLDTEAMRRVPDRSLYRKRH